MVLAANREDVSDERPVFPCQMSMHSVRLGTSRVLLYHLTGSLRHHSDGPCGEPRGRPRREAGLPLPDVDAQCPSGHHQGSLKDLPEHPPTDRGSSTSECCSDLESVHPASAFTTPRGRYSHDLSPLRGQPTRSSSSRSPPMHFPFVLPSRRAASSKTDLMLRGINRPNLGRAPKSSSNPHEVFHQYHPPSW